MIFFLFFVDQFVDYVNKNWEKFCPAAALSPMFCLHHESNSPFSARGKREGSVCDVMREYYVRPWVCTTSQYVAAKPDVC